MEQETIVSEAQSLLSSPPEQFAEEIEFSEPVNPLKVQFRRLGETLTSLALKIFQRIEPEQRRKVRELIVQLADEDDGRTSDALRELRELGLAARSAVPWVKQLLLEDPSAEIRSRALVTLLKISPRPSKDIIRACSDKEQSIRLRLAHYFAYEWANTDGIFTAYLKTLVETPFLHRLTEAVRLSRDPESGRALGLTTLRNIKYVVFPDLDEGENEEKVLVYFLRDADKEIRKLTVVGLGSVPWGSERINSALAKVLFDGDISVREWALESLELRKVSLFILLRSIANDNNADPAIRSWALSRLASDHGEKALAFFVNLHRDDATPPAVKRATMNAVAKVKLLQKRNEPAPFAEGSQSGNSAAEQPPTEQQSKAELPTDEAANDDESVDESVLDTVDSQKAVDEELETTVDESNRSVVGVE